MSETPQPFRLSKFNFCFWMSLIRRCTRTFPAMPTRNSVSDVTSEETTRQKVLRWMDITGFLSRYHSRREWVLDLDPLDRIGALRTTEYERKFKLMRTGFAFLIWPIVIYLVLGEMSHLNSPTPLPVQLEFSYVNNARRESQMSRLISFYRRCQHCRPLEQDCKKECFDRIRAAGYPVYGLNHVRVQNKTSWSTY